MQAAGGEPVVCKSGHAFIKEKMRTVDAAYGGEMSAHHYFREFSYCDSGMIPWLQVVEAHERGGAAAVRDGGGEDRPLPGQRGDQLTSTTRPRPWPPCGPNTQPGALAVDETDGLSIEYPPGASTCGSSNTEPVVRVNVETRADRRSAASQDRRNSWRSCRTPAEWARSR